MTTKSTVVVIGVILSIIGLEAVSALPYIPEQGRKPGTEAFFDLEEHSAASKKLKPEAPSKLPLWFPAVATVQPIRMPSRFPVLLFTASPRRPSFPMPKRLRKRARNC